MIYKIERGSPISFSADVMSGQASDASAVAAPLRSIPGRSDRPTQNEPIAATLTVTPRLASVDWPEGWTIFLGGAGLYRHRRAQFSLSPAIIRHRAFSHHGNQVMPIAPGYSYTEHPGLTADSLFLKVKTDFVAPLQKVVEAAQLECKSS